MPGAFTLLNDPRALGSTRQETLGSRLGFSLIPGAFRNPVLIVFYSFTFDNRCVVVASVLVMVFRIAWSKSGRLGLKRRALVLRKVD